MLASNAINSLGSEGYDGTCTRFLWDYELLMQIFYSNSTKFNSKWICPEKFDLSITMDLWTMPCRRLRGVKYVPTYDSCLGNTRILKIIIIHAFNHPFHSISILKRNHTILVFQACRKSITGNIKMVKN